MGFGSGNSGLMFGFGAFECRVVCDDGPRFTAILRTPGDTIVTDKARSARKGVSLVRGLERVSGRQHLEAAKIQSL